MTGTNQFTHQKLLGQYLTEFQRQLLKKNLEAATIAEYRQRIKIMLLADEGHTQSQICRILSCSPLTARHWIFMAKSGQAHNWQAQPIGRPKIVTIDYLERLKELVKTSPKDFGYPFSRWTGQWLSKHLAQEFNIRLSARHINRLLAEIEVEANLTRTIKRQQSQISRSQNLIIADLFDRHK